MVPDAETVEPDRDRVAPESGDDRREGPTASRINWARWFLIIGGLIGVVGVFLIPVDRGPDEFAQLARVVTIDRGYAVPVPADEQPADYAMDSCLYAYVWVGFLGMMEEPPPRYGARFSRPICADHTQPFHRDGRSRIGNTEVNPPIPYLPALVGYRVGRAIGGPPWAFHGARLAQLVGYLLLGFWAISCTPRGKPFLFALALLPASIQLAGTISADPITIGIAFVVVAMTLRFVERARQGAPAASRGVLVGHAALLVLLVLCKTVNTPLLGISLLIPTAVFGSRRRRVGYLAATIVTALAVAAAWTFGVVSRTRVTLFFGTDSLTTTPWIRDHPFEFAAAALRAWTHLEEVHKITSELVTVVTNAPLQPWWLIAAVLAAVVTAFTYDAATPRIFRRLLHGRSGHEVDDEASTTVGTSDEVAAHRRQTRLTRGVIVLILVAAFWLIEFGVALSANPRGAHLISWVQGRYFIPFAPLALFLVEGRTMPTTEGRRRVVLTAMIPLAFLVGVNVWWLSVVARTFTTW